MLPLGIRLADNLGQSSGPLYRRNRSLSDDRGGNPAGESLLTELPQHAGKLYLAYLSEPAGSRLTGIGIHPHV